MRHLRNSLRTNRHPPFWPSDDEYQRDDEQKQDAHEPEYTQEAQQRCLLLHHAIEHCQGAATRGGGVGTAPQEQPSSLFQRLPGEGAIVRHMRGQHGLIELGAPRNPGGDEGNAHARADVPHDAVKAGGIAGLRLWNRVHGEDREGDEGKGGVSPSKRDGSLMARPFLLQLHP